MKDNDRGVSMAAYRPATRGVPIILPNCAGRHRRAAVFHCYIPWTSTRKVLVHCMEENLRCVVIVKPINTLAELLPYVEGKSLLASSRERAAA